MRELEYGMFARSLAGHDKGRLYIVLEAEEESVILADGKRRTLANPKKKKRKHVQPDFSKAELLEELRRKGRTVRDEDIRIALKNKEEC